MVTHATLPRPVVQLAGSLVLLAVALGAFGTQAQSAPRPCGDRTELLKQLQQRHDETPRALGLSSDGGVLEVLVSPDGGWTILVTYPKRPTCVVAVGEAWQTLQLTSGDPA